MRRSVCGSVPTRSQRRPMIWRYGEVEYHFGDDGRVWLISTEDEGHNPRVLGKLVEGCGGRAEPPLHPTGPADKLAGRLNSPRRPGG